jgi:hypothetical protein
MRAGTAYRCARVRVRVSCRENVFTARVQRRLHFFFLCFLAQESELLELLAPRGKKQLPPIVWARLYRSLELYLHPLGDEDENGMLGFFSQQMVHAVRKRYLQVRPRVSC